MDSHISITNPTTNRAENKGRAAGFFLRRLPMAVGYHCVSETPRAHVSNVGCWKNSARFEADVRWMVASGPILHYDEVDQACRSTGRFPAGAFHLSFDDGYTESATVVAPILRRYDAPATFFVCPDFLDNRVLFYRNLISLCVERLRNASSSEESALRRRIGEAVGRSFASPKALERRLLRLYQDRLEEIQLAADIIGVDGGDFLRTHSPYLTGRQVRELAAEGFTIGAHSLGHPRLSLVDEPSEVEREIVDSCRKVAEMIGETQVPFSFPFGASRLDRSFLADVRRRHSVVGRLFDATGIGDDPIVINRAMADETRRAGGEVTDLPRVISRAWRHGLVKRLKRRVKRLAVRSDR